MNRSRNIKTYDLLALRPKQFQNMLMKPDAICSGTRLSFLVTTHNGASTELKRSHSQKTPSHNMTQSIGIMELSSQKHGCP